MQDLKILPKHKITVVRTCHAEYHQNSPWEGTRKRLLKKNFSQKIFRRLPRSRVIRGLGGLKILARNWLIIKQLQKAIAIL